MNSDIRKEQRVLKTLDALSKVGITPIIFSHTKSFDNAICFPLPVIERKAKHLNYPVLIRKVFSLVFRVSIKVNEILNRYFNYDSKIIAEQILTALLPYNENIPVVVTHHLKNLPIGSTVADQLGAKLIFNAHEYYPEQFTEYEGWEQQRDSLNRIGHDFLNKCYMVFNVCQGIMDRYERVFSLKPEQQILVTNATRYYELKPSEVGEVIKLIHHGIANRNRQLELMISVADKVPKDKFEFYFMLVPSPYDTAYFEQLKAEIEKRSNCFLLEPVPTTEIAPSISKFDLGFYLYNNKENFNMQHYLPNKLYEFIQARLGVVIGPYVEMKRVVDDYKIGIVVGDNDVDKVAEVLATISKEDVVGYKRNTISAAVALKGENEIDKMAAVFTKISA
ncbi:MAG: hypothetical protein H6551_05705 [Chitinophagales bacterium]|nr:hypothetical protein [Chitinophagales bacterium]